MWLTSVQHGGLGDVDSVVPVLDSESGRGLLEFGVMLPIIFFLVIWFVLVHGDVESVVICVDIFLKVIQVAKRYSPVLKRKKNAKREKKRGKKMNEVVYSVLV